MQNGVNSGDGPSPSKSGNEIIQIRLHRGTEGLGFNIRGGHDMRHIAEDSDIFVTKIRPGGAAAVDGRLAVGDKILTLNGNTMQGISHQTAVTLFKSAGDRVDLTILENAERNILEASAKKAAARQINGSGGISDSAKLLGALGAVALLGFTVYKFRHNFRSFLFRLFPSRSYQGQPFSYPPYNSK